MRFASFVLPAALLMSVAASAQTIVPNADEGRVKSYTCIGCHGISGWRNAYPNYRVPRIWGQHYEYLVQALTDYREGARKHPTMRAQGEALSDQDIANIAAFLAGSVPQVAAATPVEATPVEATPVEATPVEATPVEAAPAETTPPPTGAGATTPPTQ